MKVDALSTIYPGLQPSRTHLYWPSSSFPKSEIANNKLSHGRTTIIRKIAFAYKFELKIWDYSIPVPKVS